MQSKKLSDKEVAGLLSADGPIRYDHFVKQVADWELVWGLRDEDGWVSMGVSNDKGAFPVWPHEAYARLLATEAFANARPTSIEVQEWVESWLPGLARGGTQVAVFPTPAGKGVVVHPEKLRADIEAELSRLE
jgi:hypothetical protein